MGMTSFRLELSSAALGIKLNKMVRKKLEIKVDKVVFCTVVFFIHIYILLVLSSVFVYVV